MIEICLIWLLFRFIFIFIFSPVIVTGDQRKHSDTLNKKMIFF